MKTERRHELQENELALSLAKAREFIGQNSRTLTIGLAVVAGVFILGNFAVRSRAASREDQWRRLGQLTFSDPTKVFESIAALRVLSEEAGDDAFRMTSLFELGMQSLIASQKSEAPPDRKLLETARGAYEKLIGTFPNSPLALGTARLGLATIEEDMYLLTRDAAHKSRAREHLTSVVDDTRMASLPLYRLALDRRNALDTTLTLVAFAPPVPGAPVAPRFPPGFPSQLPPGLPPELEEQIKAMATVEVETPEGIKTVAPNITVKPTAPTPAEPAPNNPPKPEGSGAEAVEKKPEQQP